MDKKYYIRILIFDSVIGNLVNEAIDCDLLALKQSLDGKGDVLAIYDGEVSANGLKTLLWLGVYIFPLNHYEDFVITCPNCGERIDDDMILLAYDDTLLSGNNISCNRKDCGYQRAKVEFINK